MLGSITFEGGVFILCATDGDRRIRLPDATPTDAAAVLGDLFYRDTPAIDVRGLSPALLADLGPLLAERLGAAGLPSRGAAFDRFRLHLRRVRYLHARLQLGAADHAGLSVAPAMVALAAHANAVPIAALRERFAEERHYLQAQISRLNHLIFDRPDR